MAYHADRRVQYRRTGESPRGRPCGTRAMRHAPFLPGIPSGSEPSGRERGRRDSPAGPPHPSPDRAFRTGRRPRRAGGGCAGADGSPRPRRAGRAEHRLPLADQEHGRYGAQPGAPDGGGGSTRGGLPVLERRPVGSPRRQPDSGGTSAAARHTWRISPASCPNCGRSSRAAMWPTRSAGSPDSMRSKSPTRATADSAGASPARGRAGRPSTVPSWHRLRRSPSGGVGRKLGSPRGAPSRFNPLSILSGSGHGGGP